MEGMSRTDMAGWCTGLLKSFKLSRKHAQDQSKMHMKKLTS